MKSTHVKNETEEIEFPCLMKLNDYEVIVLAIVKVNKETFRGIVLNDNPLYKIGDLIHDFTIKLFHTLPKGEQIILEN